MEVVCGAYNPNVLRFLSYQYTLALSQGIFRVESTSVELLVPCSSVNHTIKKRLNLIQYTSRLTKRRG